MASDDYQEPVNEVLCEMWENGEKWIADKSPNKTECLGLIVSKYADRINAALKREKCLRVPIDVWNHIVDRIESADALREVVEALTDKLYSYLEKGLVQLPLPIEEATKRVRAAIVKAEGGAGK